MSGLKLGFVGTGWIGRHRMAALNDAGLLAASVVCDPSSTEAASALSELPPGSVACASLDDLLSHDLDGVVIASPSALHAEQTLRALDHGLPVFCQKPLGRSAAEVRAVVTKARTKDLLLGADFSYRECVGVRQIYDRVRAGDLGHVFAVDLIFHNAYGPGKPWFFDPRQSGGGCLVDLGVHLVDLGLWTLGFPKIERVNARLFKGGRPLVSHQTECEDFATATLDCAGDVVVNLQCSWNLSAGQDAVIEAKFYGTNGSLSFRNVNGSFYDFLTERLAGTTRETLSAPPEAWGGRRVVRWARRLTESPRFDDEANEFVTVAEALDAIYGVTNQA